MTGNQTKAAVAALLLTAGFVAGFIVAKSTGRRSAADRGAEPVKTVPVNSSKQKSEERVASAERVTRKAQASPATQSSTPAFLIALGERIRDGKHTDNEDLLDGMSRGEIMDLLAAVNLEQDNSYRMTALQLLLNKLAESDPAAAVNWVVNDLINPASQTQTSHLVYPLIGKWAVKDLQAAVNYAEQHELGSNAFREIIKAYAPINHEYALELVSVLNARSNANLRESDVWYSWISKDAASAMAALEQRGLYGDYESMYRFGLSELAKKDPLQALDRASRAFQGSSVADAQSRILSQWMKDDAAAAFQWVAGQTGNPHQRRLYESMLRNYVSAKPGEAADFVARLADKQTQRSIAGKVAYTLAYKKGPVYAMDWALSLADEQSRKNAMKSAASSWSSKDPAAAIDFLMQTGDMDTYKYTIENSLRNWARKDIMAAVNKYNEIGSEQLSTRAVSTLTDYYYRYDPDAAANWLVGLPDKARDAGIETLVRREDDKDPAYAFSWAELLSDPKRQVYRMRSVVREWSKADPNAARAAVNSTRLSDADKTQLLKYIDESEAKYGTTSPLTIEIPLN